MRYSTFGRRTGLRVSEFALGTANFGTGWGSGANTAESKRMLDRYAEAGGNFLDTAENYQAGESEKFLGDLLRADREHFVLASKFGFGAEADPGISGTGNSRRKMVRAVEASLERLQTDYLDLYWVHAPDSVTPTEEIVRGFDDLVRAGKILHGGLSNFPAWRVARAATITELRGIAPLVGVQAEYSLAERTAERDLLPMAEGLGLGVVLYSPLAGGLLTGKYRSGAEGRLTTWKSVIHVEDDAQKVSVVDTLLKVAADLGRPPAEVATAWVRERGRRAATTVLPIIGPRTVGQLDSYLAALDLELSDQQYRELDEVSAVRGGVPHDIVTQTADALLGGHGADFDRPAPVA
ncbi:aldo/keto reductase [Amycolatopsis sp. NPDC005961]|uniref:aldo/keto reductase n=1 Tax=Amycolatopsis sp. NPDC005961 TaxID=3156720 RepID=UPI0033C3F811